MFRNDLFWCNFTAQKPGKLLLIHSYQSNKKYQCACDFFPPPSVSENAIWLGQVCYQAYFAMWAVGHAVVKVTHLEWIEFCKLFLVLYAAWSPRRANQGWATNPQKTAARPQGQAAHKNLARKHVSSLKCFWCRFVDLLQHDLIPLSGCTDKGLFLFFLV